MYILRFQITRPGGHLITAEWGVLGNRRRYLGALYQSHDEYASIAPEYRVNRKRGYIAQTEPDKMYGFILIIDDQSQSNIIHENADGNTPNTLLNVHIDECHMIGARKLRRFMEVEFVIDIDNQTGRKMATHVTAPDLRLLRYHSANHFVSSAALSRTLDPRSTSKHIGIVTKTPMHSQEPYVIKPSEV